MTDFFPHAELSAVGLNLVAVLDVSTLPANLHDRIAQHYALAHYRQLILIGHAGKDFWNAMQASGPAEEDPVDTFTRRQVTKILTSAMQDRRYELLYPGAVPLDLQALGTLAGWHHASPFWVGINARHGSWFAYRALVLADSEFPVSTPLSEPSPCDSCTDTPCIRACPANAMEAGQFHIQRCIEWRRQPESPCRYQCLARNACPVGQDSRYDTEQMRHHYTASIKFIERHL